MKPPFVLATILYYDYPERDNNAERNELLDQLEPCPLNASNLEKYIEFAT
ncbi:hypothetical protein SAMN05428949_6828 [Chitinophaga sp. YR627]|nr:hypothetical protein SAMN05428949_6828 [Chitinophaga sp. YR627]